MMTVTANGRIVVLSTLIRIALLPGRVSYYLAVVIVVNDGGGGDGGGGGGIC